MRTNNVSIARYLRGMTSRLFMAVCVMLSPLAEGMPIKIQGAIDVFPGTYQDEPGTPLFEWDIFASGGASFGFEVLRPTYYNFKIELYNSNRFLKPAFGNMLVYLWKITGASTREMVDSGPLDLPYGLVLQPGQYMGTAVPPWFTSDDWIDGNYGIVSTPYKPVPFRLFYALNIKPVPEPTSCILLLGALATLALLRRPRQIAISYFSSPPEV